MAQALIFTGQQALDFQEQEHQDLGADHVRVRGICSLMSTGTENIVYNRLFEAGSHWDNWVKYPFTPGYSWIGEVVECGADVNNVEVGQRVALRSPHAEEQCVPASDCLAIPEGIDPETAAWFALAKITYSAVRAADITLGQNILIIGGGPIGQMALRWMRNCGAKKIVLVDPLPLRQDIAKQGGAHKVIGKKLGDAQQDIMDSFDGLLPDVVIDSTGNAAVFEQALQVCKTRGKVVILGDTGSPTAQHLTKDVITRRIQIIGAHDCHFENQEPVSLFFQMLNDGRINMDGMNTQHFEFRDAASAYQLANEQRDQSMGIIFRY